MPPVLRKLVYSFAPSICLPPPPVRWGQDMSLLLHNSTEAFGAYPCPKFSTCTMKIGRENGTWNFGVFFYLDPKRWPLGSRSRYESTEGVRAHAPMPRAVRMPGDLGRDEAPKLRPKSPPCKRIRARLNVPKKNSLQGVAESMNSSTLCVRSRRGGW